MSEFMGRMDLESVRCRDCGGKGRDRKKKKRKCPVCGGTGRVGQCPKCKKLASRGGEDASGQYRIGEDEVCKCYDGILM